MHSGTIAYKKSKYRILALFILIGSNAFFTLHENTQSIDNKIENRKKFVSFPDGIHKSTPRVRLIRIVPFFKFR